MKTLARAVTYSLLALILGASMSITWTTGLFWIVMGLCAAAGAGILAAQWVKASRDLDNAFANLQLEDDGDETWCDIHGHNYAANPAGWRCANCGVVVRQPLNCGGLHRWVLVGQSLTCTVCGLRKSRNVYDNESGVA